MTKATGVGAGGLLENLRNQQSTFVTGDYGRVSVVYQDRSGELLDLTRSIHTGMRHTVSALERANRRNAGGAR
ncbi:hypothetical protein [Pseudorhodoferax sp. Leaf265]|uniref:hypothetical protein n=1 Tax=Pseudorhodoferax sp. Leaf265 TaxID=1736315 RepID=UPI0012E98059|nr:hypothetical protein [Pseudorhodoferax sp. Leaf265]